MDNGIAFTDWVNDSMKDQDVKTAIFQIMEHNEKLRAAGDAMSEALEVFNRANNKRHKMNQILSIPEFNTYWSPVDKARSSWIKTKDVK